MSLAAFPLLFLDRKLARELFIGYFASGIAGAACL
jgi:hypothetical protein